MGLPFIPQMHTILCVCLGFLGTLALLAFATSSSDFGTANRDFASVGIEFLGSSSF